VNENRGGGDRGEGMHREEGRREHGVRSTTGAMGLDRNDFPFFNLTNSLV